MTTKKELMPCRFCETPRYPGELCGCDGETIELLKIELELAKKEIQSLEKSLDRAIKLMNKGAELLLTIYGDNNEV